MTIQLSRRTILAGASAAAAALLIPITADAQAPPAPNSPPRTPSTFLRIGADGRVTLILPTSEMGQGTHTGQAQILIEELGADWNAFDIEMPKQPSPEYRLPFGEMRSVGSFGIRFWHDPMRRAAAQAREMLTQVAATRLGVAPSSLTVRDGFVAHAASSRRLGFGELVAEAMTLAIPSNPVLRTASERTLTGTSVKTLNVRAKTTGALVYGEDVRLPDMLYGAVRLSPVHSAQVASVDEASIRGLPGVVGIARVSNGVVVIAKSWWQAKQAAEKLDVRFTKTLADTLTSAEINRRLSAALDRTDVPMSVSRGDVAGVFNGSGTVVTADYAVPMLTHTPMEPINCTARATSDRTELWIGTQGHDVVRKSLERELQVSADRLFINSLTIGGGFGRKTHGEIAVQAVAASRAAGGRPVKVIWTREDDVQQGQYRQPMMARFRATLGADGRIAGMRIRVAGPQMGPAYGLDPDAIARARGFKANVDPFSLNGLIDMHYAVPNLEIDHAVVDLPIPLSPWRSIANSFTGFFLESFIDECAAVARQEPLAYRRAHLTGNPRMLGVLDRVAEMSNWSSSAPAGRWRGLAVVDSYGSAVAEVVEISLSNGRPKVERIHVAIDCGRAINPGQVEQQVQGSVIDALGAALRLKVTIGDGRTEQSNFDTYPIVRMSEAPRIDVGIVDVGSPLGGAGEPGVPPLAPALLNAIYAALGRRIRSLPLSDHRLA